MLLWMFFCCYLQMFCKISSKSKRETLVVWCRGLVSVIRCRRGTSLETNILLLMKITHRREQKNKLISHIFFLFKSQAVAGVASFIHRDSQPDSWPLFGAYINMVSQILNRKCKLVTLKLLVSEFSFTLGFICSIPFHINNVLLLNFRALQNLPSCYSFFELINTISHFIIGRSKLKLFLQLSRAQKGEDIDKQQLYIFCFSFLLDFNLYLLIDLHQSMSDYL